MNRCRIQNPDLYDVFAKTFRRYPNSFSVNQDVYNDGRSINVRDIVTVWGIPLDTQVRNIPALLHSGIVDVLIVISPDGNLWQPRYFAGTGKMTLTDLRQIPLTT